MGCSYRDVRGYRGRCVTVGCWYRDVRGYRGENSHVGLMLMWTVKCGGVKSVTVCRWLSGSKMLREECHGCLMVKWTVKCGCWMYVTLG